MLKELLKCSTQLAQLCKKKGEQSGAFPSVGIFHEDFGKVMELEKGGTREVIYYVYKLKRVAKVLASMSLCVMDMANTITNTTPSLLEAALGFDKLVSPILPLLAKRNQLFGDLASMENKLEKVQSKYKKLRCDLEESSKKKKRVVVQYCREI
jgi:hypothetical protein